MIPKCTKRFMVEVGRKCNTNCVHCYHSHEENRSFLSPEAIKHEICKWAQMGNNYCEFSGGEPSIHPAMPELIEYNTSIGLKTSIITNGIAGSGATENIIKAGLGDWLVSIHGTREINDSIMRLQGARKRQVRFLRQLQHSGSTFRFNMTIQRLNQGDLVDTALWAATWKPRIFNFIQFNPHHQWQKDIEGTKNLIGDLNVLEEQLCEAIPILLDAGVGVNVRYFPMCRLPEAFRMHVCNDLQVLFDPYEWANYCEGDKNFKNYYKAGENMSRSIEWKGQPCQRCDLRFICGGINSAYFRALNMDQSLLTPIKDSSIVRDDIYHYRRNNKACLQDRIKSTDNKVSCVVVDEKDFAFVPIIIENQINNNPDGDLIIFAHYSGHEEVRKITDRFIGYGIYDHFVKNVSTLEFECKELKSKEGYALLEERFNLTEEFSIIEFSGIEIKIDKLSDVVTACSQYDKRISDVVTKIRNVNKKVSSGNKDQVKSTKKLKFEEKHYDGELLIMTTCNENYQWYIPMFLRSMQISYPTQKVEIAIMGKFSNEIKKICHDHHFNVELREFPLIHESNYKLHENFATAAIRFLNEPHSMEFGYYLITDIDILFYPHQNKNIVDQHMMHLNRDQTVCYENLITEWVGDNPRMPGIHFVTKEWWGKTKKAREKELSILTENGANNYSYDELMLGRIVLASGLPITKDPIKMQWKHGIHLGDFRINQHKKMIIRQDTFSKMHIRTLLDDVVFMELANRCTEHIEFIGKTVKKWPLLFK